MVTDFRPHSPDFSCHLYKFAGALTITCRTGDWVGKCSVLLAAAVNAEEFREGVGGGKWSPRDPCGPAKGSRGLLSPAAQPGRVHFQR